MSSHTTDTRPIPTPDTDPPERRPLLDLSLTQIVGGSLAAASAAAVTSTLGVAGTILGAAVISLVSAVAGAIYTQSLRHTKERVQLGTRAVRQSQTGSTAAPIGSTRRPAPVGRPTLRPRSLLIGTAAVFALALAGITGYELATGAPISGGNGGTTLNEVTGTGKAATLRSPADQAPTSEPSEPSTADPTAPTTTDPAPTTSTSSPASSTTTSPTGTGSTTPTTDPTSQPPTTTPPTTSSPPPAP